LTTWSKPAEPRFGEGEGDLIGLKGELLQSAVGGFCCDRESAGRDGRGAVVRYGDITGQRPETGACAVVCIVLCVDVLQAPLAAGGDVVGKDGCLDELEYECGRLFFVEASAFGSFSFVPGTSFCSTSSRLLPSGRTFK